MKELKDVRKKQRNQATSAEAILWKLLSGRKCGGLKFRRQHSAGPYILDFYCPEAKLAIELDGDVHIYPLRNEYDVVREAYLESKSIKILRIKNKLVFERADVLEEKITGYALV